MTTREEAKAHWASVQNKFKIDKPTRLAWTGDGYGAGTSNYYVGFMPEHIWAREIDGQPFPVLNRGRVVPAINVPIVLGYDDIEPDHEQVLGINWDALPTESGAGSTIFSIGAHHWQHEWYGGDEVFLDSRQILPGLVKPTDPPSMQTCINNLTYYANGWNALGSAISIDFSSCKPSNQDQKAIIVAINTNNNKIAYVEGEDTSGSVFTWGAILEGTSGITNVINLLPKHTPFYKPLGAVLLSASTTQINWTAAVDNLLDLRYHSSFDTQTISNLSWKLDEVQLRTGFDSNLTTAGAATSRASSYRSNAGQLQGYGINNADPENNQVLAYDSASGVWKPKTDTRHFSVTIGASNTWNNELIPLWQGPKNASATLTEILATTQGTLTNELNFKLQHRDWDAMHTAGNDLFGTSQLATSAGEQITSFDRSTIDPRAHLMFTTGSAAESGSVNYIQLTISYKI